MESTNKVHTSAVVIIPEQWSAIQPIREKHDKAYQRWMPHINLLYPFVPESFATAKEKVTKALRGFGPFTIDFNSMGYFSHGRNATLFLKPTPEAEVVKLQARLKDAFPFCDDLNTMSSAGFQPHLTLGQFPSSSVETEKARFMQDWKPQQEVVKCVHIISRQGDNPFSIKHTINLVATPEDQVTASAPEEEQVLTAAPDSTATNKVRQWIIARKATNNLPKSADKLQNAIAKMCEVNCELNVDIALLLLKSNRVIHYEASSDKVRYEEVKSKQVSLDEILKTKKLTTEEQTEIQTIMQKVINWLHTMQPKPKTLATLRTATKQLCKFKRTLDPRSVIDSLRVMGVVDEASDSSMIYKV